MNKIGMAVIGCGAMAQGMHLPNIKKHPLIDLLWCCDLNEDILEEVKKKFSPKKVTTKAQDIAQDPDCQAVVISTTHRARFSLIKLFSDAGKHIYVEKPLADSFKEMFAIAEQVKKTGIKFCVGHNRRMAPAAQEAKKIYVKHKTNPVSPAWRWDRAGDKRPKFPEEKQTMILLRVNDDCWSWKEWAFAEGSLINEMTHFVDLACYFLDNSPVEVITTGTELANNIVTITFEDGSLATIFMAAVGSFGYPKELIEIYHQGAAIIVDHLIELRTAGVIDEPFTRTFPLADGKKMSSMSDYYKEILAVQKEALAAVDNSILPPSPDKGHYRLLDVFVKEIAGGPQTPCGIDEAMKSTAITLKAIESLEKGCAQKIRQDRFVYGDKDIAIVHGSQFPVEEKR